VFKLESTERYVAHLKKQLEVLKELKASNQPAPSNIFYFPLFCNYVQDSRTTSRTQAHLAIG